MNGFELGTVYFHTDYDGLVSAAMLVRLGNGQPQLKGVDYDMKPTWANLRLDRASAVVDFLYHPDAVMWFDHHGTPFVRPDWQSGYRRDAYHCWNPKSLACPPVIASCLGLHAKDRQHFADYIYWSEIIDAARYETPIQAHDLSNPHIVLSRIVSLMREPPTLADLVCSIATQPVESVIRRPEVRLFVDAARDLEQRLQQQLRSHVVYDGQVAFLDQSDEPGFYQRYLPYLFHPDAGFVVGIYRKGDAFNVSVGANPWKAAPPLHIGRLCQKWGGGGHPKIGGVTVSAHDDALRIASAIRAELEGKVH